MTSKNSAFSLVEMIVTIGILLCLAALSWPALQRTFSSAKTMECSSNMHVLGTASIQYAADHGMFLPATMHQAPGGAESWTNTLQPYTTGRLTFKCPSDENRSRERTYVMNDMLSKAPWGAPFLDYSSLPKLSHQMDVIHYVEAAASSGVPDDHFHFSDYWQAEMPAGEFATWVGVKRHSGRANYLFVDGHVETLSWDEVQKRLANFNDRFFDPSR